jgi:hypothetical protein
MKKIVFDDILECEPLGLPKRNLLILQLDKVKGKAKALHSIIPSQNLSFSEKLRTVNFFK